MSENVQTAKGNEKTVEHNEKTVELQNTKLELTGFNGRNFDRVKLTQVSLSDMI